MRLAEIMACRRTVGAGLLVTVTERCPLHCAHCSASATRHGRSLERAALLRFLGTFGARCRPEVLMLTGGEPLTRPGLVVEAADTVRAAGTRTAVLSGAFFAAEVRAGGRLPAAVDRVARAVAHFSLSLDAFHEREIAREDVYATLDALLRTGTATSLHLLADGPADPYPDEVAGQVLARFGTDVPMLVSEVRPIGRGAGLHPPPAAGRPPLPRDPFAAAPCAMAAWPVVAADGAITACCNQDVVDGRARPGHLRLGDIRTSTWQDVREQARTRPLLRVLRTVGPVHLAARAAAPPGLPAADGYCRTCHRLDREPRASAWAEATGAGAVGEVLEAAAQRATAGSGAVSLVASHGSRRHAHLLDPSAGYGGAGGGGA